MTVDGTNNITDNVSVSSSSHAGHHHRLMETIPTEILKHIATFLNGSTFYLFTKMARLDPLIPVETELQLLTSHLRKIGKYIIHHLNDNVYSLDYNTNKLLEQDDRIRNVLLLNHVFESDTNDILKRIITTTTLINDENIHLKKNMAMVKRKLKHLLKSYGSIRLVSIVFMHRHMTQSKKSASLRLVQILINCLHK